MKKALKSFVVLIVALTLAICGSLAAFADEYGTPSAGIPSTVHQGNQHQLTPTDSFKNGDFKEGLRYWTTVPPNTRPTQYVDVKKDGDKVYITLTPNAGSSYDGIVSSRFIENRLNEGDKPVVIYDWRCDKPEKFQVYLGQALLDESGKSGNGYEVRIANGAQQQVPIISAATPEEWNTSMNKNVAEVQLKSKRGGNDYCFFIGVQAFQSDSVKADIANLRLGFYNQSEGIVYDLDGKVMYDLNEINAGEAKNFYTYEDPFSFPAMDIVFSDDGKATQVNENDNDHILIWAITAGSVILVIATVIVVTILIKKRKAAVTLAECDSQDTEKEEQNNE